ncbi:MAG: OmpA family protein [Rubellimicrobium sp.]|nr:OmpA family protein [Rubellimicrobium sp.]
MRLRPVTLSVLAFVVAALVAWAGARVLTRILEERSVIAVREALIDSGTDWASVLGDGLQIVLEGEAPTEAQRFRAITVAGGVVDASRVIDNMRVAAAAGLRAPDFVIEILRNDSGVSLVGLVPAATDRDGLSRRIESAAAGQPVADLLQTADYPVPPGWAPALDFAFGALGRLPRAKISVTAGQVEITAIATSREERRRLESELGRSAPPGVDLTLAISAPRQVIAPFTLRLVLEGGVARFDACAADTEEARAAILAAATEAGAPADSGCTLALGTPSALWSDAAVKGIRALAALGGGTLTLSNADVALVAAEGTDPALFERVSGELEGALPRVFSLTATLPESPAAVPAGPPEFSVALTGSGAVLRGRITDQMMATAVESLAQAAFGADRVTMATRILPDGLPPGWSVRVLAGIEALSHVVNGTLRVRPDTLVLSGTTSDPEAQDRISRILIDRLGREAGFELDLHYDETLDPLAALPSPEECIASINAVTAARKITFDPGSATLSGPGMAVLDEIARILRGCSEMRLRIAGYTDSQGRDETNLRLSQARAEAVLNALLARRVPVGGFEAIGFGEVDPIADNATESGREANRRIEFSLIGAAPAAAAAAGGPDAGDAEGAHGPDQEGATGGPPRPEIRPSARPEGLAPQGGAGD